MFLEALTSMARKTVADIPSATWYSFLSFTCVTLFSSDVVNILNIKRHTQRDGYLSSNLTHVWFNLHNSRSAALKPSILLSGSTVELPITQVYQSTVLSSISSADYLKSS